MFPDFNFFILANFYLTRGEHGGETGGETGGRSLEKGVVGRGFTLPIAKILSVKNARAWVSMDFT